MFLFEILQIFDIILNTNKLQGPKNPKKIPKSNEINFENSKKYLYTLTDCQGVAYIAGNFPLNK